MGNIHPFFSGSGTLLGLIFHTEKSYKYDYITAGEKYICFETTLHQADFKMGYTSLFSSLISFPFQLEH